MELLIIFLGILAGLGKAFRDTIAHHWGRCVFSKIKSRFWKKWFRSNWLDRPQHPIWFLWDGWHFFDTLSYFVYLPLLMIVTDLWQILFIVSSRWFAFWVLYHNVLLLSEFKCNLLTLKRK